MRLLGCGLLALTLTPAAGAALMSVHASPLLHDDRDARLWVHGEWRHTAEMWWNRRLPRALARFGLLPWSVVPKLVPVRPSQLA